MISFGLHRVATIDMLLQFPFSSKRLIAECADKWSFPRMDAAVLGVISFQKEPLPAVCALKINFLVVHSSNMLFDFPPQRVCVGTLAAFK